MQGIVASLDCLCKSVKCVFVSPDEGWEGEDVERAQRFVTTKFPGWKIVETDSDGETRVNVLIGKLFGIAV